MQLMANEANNFQELISHCKEYGYIFQSSEIYDGLAAVYDYGQNGAQLKKNIRDYWWKSMTQLHDNIVGIDAAIFMHPTVWKASGHVDNFSDPMIDNFGSKKRYRVDHLIEQYIEKVLKMKAYNLKDKISKSLPPKIGESNEDMKKRFWDEYEKQGGKNLENEAEKEAEYLQTEMDKFLAQMIMLG